MAAALPATTPAVAVLPTPAGAGYAIISKAGGQYNFGDSLHTGSLAGTTLNAPIVGAAEIPNTQSKWFVAADGGVFTQGPDARFYGSLGGVRLSAPIVGVAATPSGHGYWMVASDGGVFTFGDAPFYGSLGGVRLSAPIVGMAATPSGRGYWMVASDGGVFTFGDAAFRGSLGGVRLSAPVSAIVPSPSGLGYLLVARDGGTFNFGDYAFPGSFAGRGLTSPIVSAARSSAGTLWLLSADGGIHTLNGSSYGDAAGYDNNPSASAVAAQILANANIALTGRLVRADIQDAAAGRPSSAGVPIKLTILKLIARAGDGHRVQINALESGKTGHRVGSRHYSGAAVDFGKFDGQTLTGRNAASIALAKTIMPLLPTGSGFGQVNCTVRGTPPLVAPAGISQFSDSCDHLHVQVP